MDDPRETGRERLYEGPVFRLERRVVVMGGRTVVRDVVLHPGAVVIVPLLDGDVLLVRQWRHPIGSLLEVPAGTLEPGEAPSACALRELREEVGFRPTTLLPLGTTYAAPGYSTEVLHFFLAKGLMRDPLPTPEEEGIDVVRMPLVQAARLAVEGGFEDTKTALGILQVAHREGVMGAADKA